MSFEELPYFMTPKQLADVTGERDKMRQRNSRLCRKYGLKGKRERGR